MKAFTINNSVGLFVLLLFSGCEFIQDNPEDNYIVKYGETFTPQSPVIEIDNNDRVHILANAYMLYTKEGSDPNGFDFMSRNTVTYHFMSGGSSFQSHNFENMLQSGTYSFLFGTSEYSDTLFAVVKDLRKFIIYSMNTGTWVKVRSVFTEMNNVYNFSLDDIVVNNNDVYLPFTASEWEDKNNWHSGLAGLQINDERIFVETRIDTSYEDAFLNLHAPKIINGTWYIAASYGHFGDGEHILYLYRLDNDTLEQIEVGTWPGTRTLSANIARVYEQARLFVTSDDSLKIYRIDSHKPELLSSTPGQKDSAEVDKEEPKPDLLRVNIDQSGCYHALEALYTANVLEDTVYIDGIPYIKESELDLGNSITNLTYRVQCQEPSGEILELSTEKIPLPDSLDTFHLTPYLSFAQDGKGNVHIAAILQKQLTINEDLLEEISQQLFSARLYHIHNETGEWVFDLVDVKQ